MNDSEASDRRRAIVDIEALFPADAQYQDTAALGRDFLDRARASALDWRNEPTPVLLEYARLCRAHDANPGPTRPRTQ